jgi:hypothetical protein
MIPDDQIRSRYGPHAVISRTGRFVLVHLDAPPDEIVRNRTDQFDPDAYFEAGCPLCQIQRSTGVVVFDTYPEDEEWVLLE